MKFVVILACAALVVLSSCNSKDAVEKKVAAAGYVEAAAVDPIVGNWIRYGDEKAGMCMTVTPYGETYCAKIVMNSAQLGDYGFNVGDMKWKDIKRVSDGKYSLTDLYKAPNYEPSNKPAEINFTGDSLMTLTLADDVTIKQKWRKADFTIITYTGLITSADGLATYTTTIQYNKDNGFGMMGSCSDYASYYMDITNVFNDGQTISFNVPKNSPMTFTIKGDSLLNPAEMIGALVLVK